MKSIGGIVVNDRNIGWAKTSVTTQTGGSKTIEYQGNTDYLSEALSYIKGNERYDEIAISSDPASGTSTVTLNVTAQTQNATVADSVPTDEVRMPTVSISGTMASPNLHQCPTFFADENNKLDLSAVQMVEYLMKNKGYITLADISTLNEMGKTYTKWRVYGMDTYLAPTYTMTITYYFEATSAGKTKLTETILVPGRVFTFASVVARLPNSVKPSDIGVPAWLANAPSVSYDNDGITLTQAFTGAIQFPNFYEAENENLVYAPPELPTVNYQDVAVITSGTETETDTETETETSGE